MYGLHGYWLCAIITIQSYEEIRCYAILTPHFDNITMSTYTTPQKVKSFTPNAYRAWALIPVIWKTAGYAIYHYQQSLITIPSLL